MSHIIDKAIQDANLVGMASFPPNTTSDDVVDMQIDAAANSVKLQLLEWAKERKAVFQHAARTTDRMSMTDRLEGKEDALNELIDLLTNNAPVA